MNTRFAALALATLFGAACDAQNSAPAVQAALREMPALRGLTTRLADSLRALANESNRPGFADLFSSSNVHVIAGRAESIVELSARAAGALGDAQRLVELTRGDTGSAVTGGAIAVAARYLRVAGAAGDPVPFLERAERMIRAGRAGQYKPDALSSVAVGHAELRSFEAARRVASDIDDPWVRARTQIHIGSSLIDARDTGTAINVLAEARASAEKIPSDRMARGSAFQNVAELLTRAGRRDEALGTLVNGRTPYRSVVKGTAEAGATDLVVAVFNRMPSGDEQRFYALNDAVDVYRKRGDTASMRALAPLLEKEADGTTIAYMRSSHLGQVVDLLTELGMADQALRIARGLDTAGSTFRAGALASVAGALARAGNTAGATELVTEIRGRMPVEHSRYSPFLNVGARLTKSGAAALAGSFLDSATKLARADTNAYVRYLGLQSIAEHYVEIGDRAKAGALLAEAVTTLAHPSIESRAESIAKAACIAARAGLYDRAKQWVDAIPATDRWRPAYRLWVYSVIVLENAKRSNPALAKQLDAHYWMIGLL